MAWSLTIIHGGSARPVAHATDANCSYESCPNCPVRPVRPAHCPRPAAHWWVTSIFGCLNRPIRRYDKRQALTDCVEAAIREPFAPSETRRDASTATGIPFANVETP